MFTIENITSLKTSLISCLMIMLSISSYNGYGQTTTVSATSWNTASSWNSNSVPLASGTVIVNHPLSLNIDLNCINGDYTVNSAIVDAAGGVDYNLVIGNNNGVSTITFQADGTFGGKLTVNQGGILYIKSGSTLTIGELGDIGEKARFEKDCKVVIEAGATLIINGDITNMNQSNDFEVHGSLIVSGRLTASGSQSAIFGTGNVSAGEFSGNGLVMGVPAGNIVCASSPCSTCNNISSNTITGSQSMCLGSTISAIGGPAATAASGTVSYLWESSLNNTTWIPTSYTTATLPNNVVLVFTTSFRRRAIANGCINTSNTVTVTITPSVITANLLTAIPPICIGNTMSATTGQLNVLLGVLGTQTISWESSTDNATWSNMNISTENLPATIQPTVRTYYRRKVAASGCTSISNTIDVNVNLNNNWLGLSGNWSSPTNWSCGTVPKVVQDVIIDSGTAIIDLASPYARNLTIASGASLRFDNASSLLRLDGNFTNAGNLIYNGNGTIEFTNSSSNHVISGTNNLNNIIISGNTSIHAGTTNVQTVSGVLTLKADLTTNDNLTIDLNKGLIAPATTFPTTNKLIGNVRVKRNISGYAHHYISSPVSLGSSTPITAGQLEDNTPIQYSVSNNLLSYDETKKSATLAHAPWVPVTSSSTVLEATKGYSLYMFGTADVDLIGGYDHNKEVSTPINLSFTPNASGFGGWNLIGNPYPGPLDWDAAGWNRTGMDNAVYLYNGTTKKYSIYIQGAGTYTNSFSNVINGGSRYIPAMQAFLVKRSSQNIPASLTMNNSVRASSFPYANGEKSFYRQESEEGQALKLTAQSGIYSEETLIRFLPQATDEYDSQLDANSMGSGGETPSLYTTIGDITYDINSLAMTYQPKEVNLGLTTRFAGEYSIKAEELLPFHYTNILLLDKQTGKVQDLKIDSEYKFFSEKGSFANRFKIMFAPETITSIKSEQKNKVHVSSSSEGLTLLFDNTNLQTATIKVIDMTGRTIYMTDASEISDGRCFIPANQLESGCLLVNVLTGEELYTNTVIVNK